MITLSSINIFNGVLIVAKCIVNDFAKKELQEAFNVLIVAKCIVNKVEEIQDDMKLGVLIVAKCIVNIFFIEVLKL